MNNRFCLALLGALAATVAVETAQGASIDLQFSDANITTGESFTVDVVADVASDFNNPLDELLAFGFDVDVSGPLSFDGFVVGGDFLDDSALFADVDVAGSAFPGLSGITSVLLATLSFSATAVGDGAIGVTADIDNNPSQGLFFSRVSGIVDVVDLEGSTDVAIGEPSAVPTPSVLALLALGFAGLFARRPR